MSDSLKKARKYLNQCLIPNCTVDLRVSEPGTSVHRIPTTHHREEWVKFLRTVLGKPNFEPSATDVICSRHFTSDSFSHSGTQKRRIFPSILPSRNLPGQTSSTAENSAAVPEFDTSTLLSRLQQDIQPTPVGQDFRTENAALVHDASCPNCSHDFTVPCKPTEVAPVPNRSVVKKRLFVDVMENAEESKQGEDIVEPRSPSPQQSQAVFVTPTSRKRLKLEHSYTASPTQEAAKLIKAKLKLAALKKQTYNLNRVIKRKEIKEKTLLESLKKMKTLAESQLTSLDERYPKILQALISNESKALKIKGKSGMVYDDEIRKFAATLHYYSPRSYEVLRGLLTLPHPNTISSWMRSTDCGPGYNVEVIEKLRSARLSDKSNVMTDINLMIDEMSIKKELIWNSSTHCYEGHIDYGMGDSTDNEDLPLASDALVVMIAGISGGWKCPIGYIFTNKVDSRVLKTYLDKGFYLLNEAGFNVHSLIADGNTANVAVFEAYGLIEAPGARDTDVTYESIQTEVPNPADPTKTFGIVYDICI